MMLRIAVEVAGTVCWLAVRHSIPAHRVVPNLYGAIASSVLSSWLFNISFNFSLVD